MYLQRQAVAAAIRLSHLPCRGHASWVARPLASIHGRGSAMWQHTELAEAALLTSITSSPQLTACKLNEWSKNFEERPHRRGTPTADFPGGIRRPHVMDIVLNFEPTRVHAPIGISIGSSVLDQLMVMSSRQQRWNWVTFCDPATQ